MSAATAATIVRRHENELRATVAVGNMVTLRTEAEPISAYHWIAKSSDIAILRPSGEPRLESMNEGVLGGLARTRFRFYAVSEGTVDVTFAFIIGSTGNDAEVAERFVLHVKVVAK